jgi:hypothetical protein
MQTQLSAIVLGVMKHKKTLMKIADQAKLSQSIEHHVFSIAAFSKRGCA